MGSKDWQEAIRGLTLLRRLAVHHREECRPLLAKVLPLVLASVKSLRSSLCKTAMMTVTDLVVAFGDEVLPQMDLGGAARPASSLLSQLLLKAGSNDKKFVVDEAQRALGSLAGGCSPVRLISRLLPYAAHKNPKVRGKVAAAMTASAARLTPEQWAEVNRDALLKVAAKLLSDNTPEARDASRQLIAMLRSTAEAAAGGQAEGKENAAAAKGADATKTETEGGNRATQAAWQRHCHSVLGATDATAVLKVRD